MHPINEAAELKLPLKSTLLVYLEWITEVKNK